MTRRNTNSAGIFGKVKQHLVFKHESEVLKTRAETLRDDIMAHLEKHGEVDEKGSLFITLPAAIAVAGKEFASIKRERRVSTSFDEEAAEILLHTKGLLARVQKSRVTITSSLPAESAFVFNSVGNVIEGGTGRLAEEASVDWSTFLDQNEVYVLNQENLITDKELDSLFVEHESWAYKPLAG